MKPHPLARAKASFSCREFPEVSHPGADIGTMVHDAHLTCAQTAAVAVVVASTSTQPLIAVVRHAARKANAHSRAQDGVPLVGAQT